MMKVLIVEDNPQMRQMIRSVLARVSQEIYECGDGAEAMAAYTTHLPHWVLMDIDLPQLNGLEATRQIISAFPDAHILVVTNYDDERLRAAATAAGARGYVLKENLLDLRLMLQTQA
ncbi:MAG: response regulator transcription factor [Burkholderiales bacterium]